MPRLKIVIDNREQLCWNFPKEYVISSKGTLKSGDYALLGDDGFAIERKSFNDLVSTICRKANRERFYAELTRMSDARFPNKIIIVEATYNDIISGKYRSEVKSFVVQRFMAKLMYDGCCVFLAGNAAQATLMAYNLLRERQNRLDLAAELFKGKS